MARLFNVFVPYNAVLMMKMTQAILMPPRPKRKSRWWWWSYVLVAEQKIFGLHQMQSMTPPNAQVQLQIFLPNLTRDSG